MSLRKSSLAALAVTVMIAGSTAAASASSAATRASAVQLPVAEGAAPAFANGRHATGVGKKAKDQRPKVVRYRGRH
jgi:hypothetical protein